MSSHDDAVPARLVDLVGVERRFRQGGRTIDALAGVDLQVDAGSMVALHGRSGSGKTTLLNVVGGLDLPDAGSARVCDLELTTATRDERVRLRRERLAFVFQAFGLLPVLTAAENVEVPLRLRRLAPDARRERVELLLDLVGLGHRAAHRPAELSGGEQQRVAIARALANEPDLLVADEPTGQLDSGTGRRIMDLLRDLVDRTGLAVVVATHDPTLLGVADTALELRDGRLAAGEVRARYSGEVDRSRVLSESVTLPREPAARAADDAPWPPPVAGPLPEQDDPPEDRAPDEGRTLRWGPDGEPLED